MKLLYDLPKDLRNIVSQILQGENILFCTPYDIGSQGEYIDGWLVITEKKFLAIEDGEVLQNAEIQGFKNYKLAKAVGSGMIEAETEQKDFIIVRFSMGLYPRYTYIANILEDLSRGEFPKVISDEEETFCSKCGRPFLRGSKVCHHCASKKAIFRRFSELVKPYWKRLMVTVALFWVITGLNLISPVIYRNLIDNYLMKQKVDGLGIFLLVLAIGLCDVSRTFIEIGKNRLMIKVGSGLSRDLREKVFSKIHSLSMSYIDSRKTGELMGRVTGDTNTIQQFISNQLSFGVNQMFILFSVTVLIFVLNWKLAILMLVPIPAMYYMLKSVRVKMRKMFPNQRRISDRCDSTLHDILSGIRVVKAFGMEEKEVNRFTKISKHFADVSSRNEKTFNTVFPLLNFVMGLGNFLILYFGGKMILKQQMGLGELIQFTQYAGMLYGPLGWFVVFPRAVAEVATASERIFEILDEEEELKNQDSTEVNNIEGNVTIDKVAFGYKSYDPVLKEINLDVKPGEMIGLVGHSGSGKSTLINLIMRLYDVDGGNILIDGKNIKDIDQTDLRSQIGVVLQETFLFSGTILQNIMYAKPEAKLAEVIRAAKIANAHDFIMRFPDGYDTRVGEKGQRLSGGEKQRIAIARAILHNPRILILDEATASVDTETEYEIQEALGRLIKNRTTFAIAHRLSTLRNANRLLVIDKGKQVELGTHDELMKAKGKYFSLIMAQREMSKMKGA
jgi:ATP-binding cassette subfamily B protein